MPDDQLAPARAAAAARRRSAGPSVMPSSRTPMSISRMRLLVGEQLVAGQPGQTLGRHAVRAAQVAPVGQRDPQVGRHPAVRVGQGANTAQVRRQFRGCGPIRRRTTQARRRQQDGHYDTLDARLTAPARASRRTTSVAGVPLPEVDTFRKGGGQGATDGVPARGGCRRSCRTPGRNRPASARPVSASSTASELGAETATITRSRRVPPSGSARTTPVRTPPGSASVSGSLPSRRAQPITLSTALCRPTSSRAQIIGRSGRSAPPRAVRPV